MIKHCLVHLFRQIFWFQCTFYFYSMCTKINTLYIYNWYETHIYVLLMIWFLFEELAATNYYKEININNKEKKMRIDISMFLLNKNKEEKMRKLFLLENSRILHAQLWRHQTSILYLRDSNIYHCATLCWLRELEKAIFCLEIQNPLVYIVYMQWHDIFHVSWELTNKILVRCYGGCCGLLINSNYTSTMFTNLISKNVKMITQKITMKGYWHHLFLDI